MRAYYFDRSKTLPDGAYFPEEHTKTSVVLHFTAGMTAKSAIDTFASAPKRLGYPLGAAWVVETDGTPYKLFDDACWSYHMGIPRAIAQNHFQDRRSVGIEIVNIGPLRRVGETLCWWADDFTRPYCHMSQTTMYTEVAFRGENYYATYTREQVAAVCDLVDDVCARHEIPRVIAPYQKRHETDLEYFWDFRGIVQHVNYRKDKYDLGPAGEGFFEILLSRGYIVAK